MILLSNLQCLKFIRSFKFKKDFSYTKHFNTLMIYSKEFSSEESVKILHNLDYYLDHASQPIKQSRGRTIGLINLQNKPIVVKRYNIRGFWHGLKIGLRPSRASKSWMNAFCLQEMGIKSITPVALIEKRIGPLRRVCYFLCEYISEGVAGCDYFLDDSSDKDQWPIAIQAIQNLIEKLKLHRLHHTDFHFGNLLMVNHQPLLLDLDKLRKYPIMSFHYKHAHKKDINMLLDSLNGYPQAKLSFKMNRHLHTLTVRD